MRGKSIFAAALVAILASAAVARADEILLKDGTKISGTIVGYENDSFRVETPYGFALIRKDRVADITIAAAKKEPDPKAKSSLLPSPMPPPAPSAPPAATSTTTAPATKGIAASSVAKPDAKSPMPAQPTVSAAPTAGKIDSTAPDARMASAAVPATQPAPTTASPTPAPDPSVIRDEIRGNQYVNLTYGFQMYKPPSWDLIPAARRALPDAVAALGTDDQTTLFVIGRERATDSLDAHAATTGKKLAEAYENYRLISSRHVTVAGMPAIEQRSRGTAEGHDWSVLLLTILKGSDAFTLLGMTWAESDLIQVQENVLAKAANSLTFVSP